MEAGEDGAEKGFGEAAVGEDGEGAEVRGLQVRAGGLEGDEDLFGCYGGFVGLGHIGENIWRVF